MLLLVFFEGRGEGALEWIAMRRLHIWIFTIHMPAWSNFSRAPLWLSPWMIPLPPDTRWMSPPLLSFYTSILIPSVCMWAFLPHTLRIHLAPRVKPTNHPDSWTTYYRLPIDVCCKRTMEGNAGPTIKQFKEHRAWRDPTRNQNFKEIEQDRIRLHVLCLD